MATSPSLDVIEVLVPTTTGPLAIAGDLYPTPNTWARVNPLSGFPWTGFAAMGAAAGAGRFWYGTTVSGNTLFEALWDWHANTPYSSGITAVQTALLAF